MPPLGKVKRKGLTIKLLPTERRILRRAARLDHLPWTVFLRTRGLEAAEQRLRRHRQDTLPPAAA